MTTVAAPGPGQSLTEHFAKTVRLAVPVMLARAGLIILFTVGTVMTGRAGAEPLAFYAASLGPQTVIMAVGIGLLTGTVVFSAQMDGSGHSRECGRIWQGALIMAAALGCVFWVVLLFGEDILVLLRQPPQIAAGGGRALAGFGSGMPAIMMYMATVFFLEGINRPQPGMVVTLSANLVNAGLSWVLIYGHLGLPAMGAAGATLALSLTRWWMLLAILAYVLTMPDRARYGIGAPAAGVPLVGVVRLLKLGVPLALAILLETTTFTGTAVLAGTIGVTALAAYQVALNYMSLLYMASLGLATASAVRVGNAVGRCDRVALARSGWVGVALVIAITVPVGLASYAGRAGIAGLYTSDPAVLPIVVASMSTVALAAVFDGVQGVLIGALRGAADAIVPTLIYALSFWMMALPLAWWFGVRSGHGVPALLWSLLVGLLLASLLLAWRFHRLSQRMLP
jgi:MATE family, multidrug efflux pump